MTLSHVQRYACGKWSPRAPLWLCAAASCDVVVAGTREATLEQATAQRIATLTMPPTAQLLLRSEDRWWSKWLTHVQRYTCGGWSACALP